MSRNQYISLGTVNEQSVYEDLIIESLKFYGQDVYYLPRDEIDIDQIFGEDTASRFDSAYQIEAYIENPEGFDGGGSIFQKFGIEVRDETNFILARKTWLEEVGVNESPQIEPQVGDIIYLPLSQSFFEIMFVEPRNPFYQLQDLPTYRLSCSLYEYNSEDFETGISEIDDIQKTWSYGLNIEFITASQTGGSYTDGEILTQDLGNGVNVTGELIGSKVDGLNTIITVSNMSVTGSTDYHSFAEDVALVGSQSAASAVIQKVYNIDDGPDPDNTFVTDGQASNAEMQLEADLILDFSETNPFGDPGGT